jgi:hypothetical protein
VVPVRNQPVAAERERYEVRTEWQQLHGDVKVIGVASVNREYGTPGASCMCIHEKCMAWTAPLADPDHGRCGMMMR